MYSRRSVLRSGLLTVAGASVGSVGVAETDTGFRQADDRSVWLHWVDKVSTPVLDALGRKQLRSLMPVEAVAGHQAERRPSSPLEAMGRLLSGLAPWLEHTDAAQVGVTERTLLTNFRASAQTGLAAGIDPTSSDYMQFGATGQTLVDTAFLALALLRAPSTLLGSLGGTSRQQLITALEVVRKVQPPYINWLLFAAINEVLLRRLGVFWDRMRIDYALRSLQSWYLGDGTYSDGPSFHDDYYNSYVMHPFLLAIADELADEPAFRQQLTGVRERAQRYAMIQEHVISPNGEFPPIGRSITYRAGAFHLLADIAQRSALPSSLQPGAVRSALSAVQNRTLLPQGTFDKQGWLQIGLAGHQVALAETYISTGSLYLCSAIWLPLGLPATDPFWAQPSAAWTQKKIWAGEDVSADHSTGREERH